MSFDLAVTSCMAEGRVSLHPTGKGKLNAGDPTKLQGTVITSLQKPSIPQDDASQMLGGGPTEVGIKIASHFSNACCTSLHNKERSCCAFTKTDEYCWLLKTNVPAIMRRCTWKGGLSTSNNHELYMWRYFYSKWTCTEYSAALCPIKSWRSKLLNFERLFIPLPSTIVACEITAGFSTGYDLICSKRWSNGWNGNVYNRCTSMC